VLCAQSSPLREMMRSCQCFSHVSTIPTLTYYRADSVIRKNDIISNIINNISNLLDTEAVIYLILFLLKRVGDHFTKARKSYIYVDVSVLRVTTVSLTIRIYDLRVSTTTLNFAITFYRKS
jgi:hypothetical protein